MVLRKTEVRSHGNCSINTMSKTNSLGLGFYCSGRSMGVTQNVLEIFNQKEIIHMKVNYKVLQK